MAASGSPGPERASTHEARAARLSYLLLALAGAGAVAYNHPANATIIGYGGDLTVEPATPTVEEGTQAVADVGFSQVTSYVGSYDITIDWDPTLLSFSSVSFDQYLDGPDESVQSFTPGTGNLEVAEVSFGDLANQTGFGALPLFAITFDTIGAGISPLTIDPVANGGPLIGDAIGDSYTNFVTTNSSLLITAPPPPPVPEPDGSWLLATGLLALAGASRVRWRIRG
jgi:cohesin domain-containing protein